VVIFAVVVVVTKETADAVTAAVFLIEIEINRGAVVVVAVVFVTAANDD